jgi:hypothetical protein
MMLRVAVAIALLSMVAACADKPPPSPVLALHPPPAPPPVLLDPAAVCLAELDRRQVDYERITDFHTAEGCGIDQAVKLKSVTVPLNRPLLLACPAALDLADFEAQVVAPAAQTLLGRRVMVITSAGSYDCRGQRSDHPERLSEHALGHAVDITGFTLEDGSRVTVLKNWSGNDANAAFLHKVAAGACHYFNVVLTPKTNRLHHDHLHLDVGRYKKCDA